jgi:hypothetical protein
MGRLAAMVRHYHGGSNSSSMLASALIDPFIYITHPAVTTSCFSRRFGHASPAVVARQNRYNVGASRDILCMYGRRSSCRLLDRSTKMRLTRTHPQNSSGLKIPRPLNCPRLYVPTYRHVPSRERNAQRGPVAMSFQVDCVQVHVIWFVPSRYCWAPSKRRFRKHPPAGTRPTNQSSWPRLSKTPLAACAM